MIRRLSTFIYGVLSYLIFFGTFLYAIGFIGNLVVPKSMDSGRSGPLLDALLVDAGLLALFAIQHSVMARPWFKRAWTRLVPKQAERSTYVLLSSLALLLLFWQWQPLGGVVWDVQQPLLRVVLYALYAKGWLLVLGSTFLINHFDLFGLRQVFLYLIGREYTQLKFGTPVLYRHVRHPLYLGWLFAFWATPTMTITHLFFAVMTTVYILIAIQLEERDLVAAHAEYREYKKRVPMILPLGRKTPSPTTVKSVGLVLMIAAAVFGFRFVTVAKASDGPELPPQCSSIQVEEGNKVAFHVYARGVQIYRWSGLAWDFVSPRATLYAEDQYFGEVGTHYAGPKWESKSGSIIEGRRVAGTGCTPDPTAIAWILLSRFDSSGSGIFAKVTFVQRVNTVGGLAPSESGTYVGEVREVPYTAEYYFYRAK